MKLFFDGACEEDPSTGKRNPGGVATYGWLIKNRDDETVPRGYGSVGRGLGMTNNVAEYEGLIKGLQAAGDLGHPVTEIWGDSQLALNQSSGFWKINKPHLLKYVEKVRQLCPHWEEEVVWKWWSSAEKPRS